jgi:histidinol-phosphatase (PHP family)
MTVREIYEEAARKGLTHICVTSHHQPEEVKNNDFRQSLTEDSLKRLRSDIEQANKLGKTKLFCGIEMSYSLEDEEYIRQFLKKNKFDFVLGSIHYLEGKVISDPGNRGKIDASMQEKMTKKYFEVLKMMIKTKMFDVVAHIDIYKRAFIENNFEKDKAEWESVADALLENDVGFEINTSRTREVPGETYPEKDVMELLVNKGVRKITTGSDAHRVEDVGRRLAEAEAILKTLGVKNIYFFDKRQPKKIII